MGCNCKNKSVSSRSVLKEFPEYCTPYELQKKDHTLFTDYSEEEKRIILKLLGLENKATVIINRPDEEDLTYDSQSGLQFKDRESSEYGSGRKFLRLNIVNKLNKPEINKLTQEMFSLDNRLLTNTIFIIQYNYDLDGETITLPENSYLWFIGGSFKNGTLVCNNTFIYNAFLDLKKFLDVTLLGNFAKGTTLYLSDKLTYWDGNTWLIIGELDSEICEEPEKIVTYYNVKNGLSTVSKIIKTRGTDTGMFKVVTTEATELVMFKIKVPTDYSYIVKEDGLTVTLDEVGEGDSKILVYHGNPKIHYFLVFFIRP